jgi:ABC-type multidrug transport system fused ATPase/permease subunit
MGRIKELLERESNIKEVELPRPLNSPVRIDLESVCFEYEAGETVLEDLSLSLKPGQCLGVIGRTGSGKTTLARLLIRLYDVQKGEIYLNDISIKSFSLKSLRKKIAYVTQDVQLFSGTIRDNLTFFNKDISDQMLTEAITAMGMDEWFSKYTDGLDTRIGTGGVGLSAGESQLLTFVRLFLTNPDVIILDEVSSRLDPETERQLQKTIERLLRNRIGIIIAHKLWTLEQVEDILVLEKGKVLEYGKRAMLLNDENSRLSQLMAIGAEEVLA